MGYRVTDQADRRIASLDRLVNRSSLARFVAALTLAAGFVSAAILIAYSDDTVDGASRPFVGLGLAAFAVCGAVATLLWLAASVADAWRQAEEDRIRAS